MATFHIKKGNRLPKIEAQLFQGGSPFALAGHTVKFLMALVGSNTAKVDAAAVVTDAANGKVEYVWLAADVDTLGTYEAEWVVTKTSSSEEITFPNVGWDHVEVHPGVLEN